jgi:hypothetical protein
MEGSNPLARKVALLDNSIETVSPHRDIELVPRARHLRNVALHVEVTPETSGRVSWQGVKLGRNRVQRRDVIGVRKRHVQVVALQCTSQETSARNKKKGKEVTSK